MIVDNSGKGVTILDFFRTPTFAVYSYDFEKP